MKGYRRGRKWERKSLNREVKRQRWIGLDLMVAPLKGERLAKLSIHVLVDQQLKLPWDAYQPVVVGDVRH